jgi:hypothetical protein
MKLAVIFTGRTAIHVFVVFTSPSSKETELDWKGKIVPVLN